MKGSKSGLGIGDWGWPLTKKGALPSLVGGLVPGGRMLVIEGASHSHHLEQPGPYLAAVRDFLRE